MSYQSITFVFGEQPSAAKWNILNSNDASFHDGTGIDNGVILPNHLVTGASSANDWTWDSWTATLTAVTTPPTLGTASVNESVYTQIGKLVILKIYIKFGTSGTNAGSGEYRITNLPVTPVTSDTGVGTIVSGFGRMVDSSTGNSGFILPEFESSQYFQLVYYTSFTGSNATSITHAAPWAWNTSDTVFAGHLMYEAA